MSLWERGVFQPNKCWKRHLSTTRSALRSINLLGPEISNILMTTYYMMLSTADFLWAVTLMLPLLELSPSLRCLTASTLLSNRAHRLHASRQVAAHARLPRLTFDFPALVAVRMLDAPQFSTQLLCPSSERVRLIKACALHCNRYTGRRKILCLPQSATPPPIHQQRHNH